MDKPTAIVVGVGAEQGIGGAVCRRFASEGYHVYVAGRTEAKIAMMNDQMNKLPFDLVHRSNGQTRMRLKPPRL